MLKELNRNYAVVGVMRKGMCYDVARYDPQVGKPFGPGLALDVDALGTGVGKCCYAGIWEELGEVERC